MESITLNKKLLEFQKNISAIKKDKKNPHFKNSYSSLDEILSEVKPLLTDLGIILTQPIIDGVQYSIITDVESDEEKSSYIEIAKGLQPQQLGSCITYYRRYSLSSLLSLATEEDNDGNGTTLPTVDDKKWLNEGSKEMDNVIAAIENKKVTSIDQVEKVYRLAAATKQQLISKINGN
jgi:ERF superfamily